MIRLEGVHKSFGGVPVLTDVSLHVPAGGTLALIGEGGAGKSLILKLICGLIEPDAGRVIVDGVEVNRLAEPARMALRGRIGMIFQNYALFDYLSVAENIAFPLRRLGAAAPRDIDARVARRLAQVHLPDIGPKLPGELSGGMKKRVCLARATVHDPPIMLCDDPTAGLDPVTTNRIFALLKQLQAENRATAIIVSHEVDALRPICDRFAMLERGHLIFEGTPDEARHAAPAVRRFMTGEGIE
ncbi:MAG: ATP-binding cassette domain-containing protein [Myxococcales bacterium]|nr:ATP-binding cassette domain-containing protein [Myxococcales bacterium]MCB9548445.1 ATP-binding cassette domain-containing protein [Myxococcales bacterium]